MQYDGLAWAFALLALLAALVAGRILFERTWFLGWLRGTCGLAFVAVAALLLVLAWDLRSYSLLKPEQPMATLSFQAEGPQRYRVLIQEGANERSVVLDGELWQLDARIFRWKGLAALIGLAPGYRLDALSGRFLALEQQSRGRRLGLRVTFLPMADKAVFAVNYGVAGLLAEPMNLAAEEALRDWR
ncbi:hypothetical protein [Pseudomonas aeruginosa]|uniref:hypothetical protein n=1 Tax=Pseudomonas aeruginosa TaxID=287 RepID=UPI00071B26B4|nr:hypothetical protein [Pseudomonas aeruginosa]KSJ58343.1 hypothetical protein APA21_25795 [Pseudomonas aeruginosa]